MRSFVSLPPCFCSNYTVQANGAEYVRSRLRGKSGGCHQDCCSRELVGNTSLRYRVKCTARGGPGRLSVMRFERKDGGIVGQGNSTSPVLSLVNLTAFGRVTLRVPFTLHPSAQTAPPRSTERSLYGEGCAENRGDVHQDRRSYGLVGNVSLRYRVTCTARGGPDWFGLECCNLSESTEVSYMALRSPSKDS